MRLAVIYVTSSCHRHGYVAEYPEIISGLLVSLYRGTVLYEKHFEIGKGRNETMQGRDDRLISISFETKLR